MQPALKDFHSCCDKCRNLRQKLLSKQIVKNVVKFVKTYVACQTKKKRSESFNLKLVFFLSLTRIVDVIVCGSLTVGSANIFHLLFFLQFESHEIYVEHLSSAQKKRFSVHSYHLFPFFSIAFAEKCRHKGQIAIYNAHDVTHICCLGRLLQNEVA